MNPRQPKQDAPKKSGRPLAARYVENRDALGVVFAGEIVAANLEGHRRATACLDMLRIQKSCGSELLVDALAINAETRERQAFVGSFLRVIQKAIQHGNEVPQ